MQIWSTLEDLYSTVLHSDGGLGRLCICRNIEPHEAFGILLVLIDRAVRKPSPVDGRPFNVLQPLSMSRAFKGSEGLIYSNLIHVQTSLLSPLLFRAIAPVS